MKKPIFKRCFRNQNSALRQNKIRHLREFIMFFQTKIYLKTLSQIFIEIIALKVTDFHVNPALEQVRITQSRTAAFKAFCFECCRYALSDAVLMSFCCRFLLRQFYLEKILRRNPYLEIATSFYTRTISLSQRPNG